MSEFKPVGEVPAFKTMREMLQRLKQDVLVPMREQVKTTITALEAERERLVGSSIAPTEGSTASGVGSARPDRETAV